MIKNKVFTIFAAAFLLNFSLSNQSWAVEGTVIKNRYPDYSYEFVGKDKCEKFNRKIFVFNTKLNKFVIRPVNTVWASVMPKYGMERIQSFYTNLEFPIRLTSCLVQKDFKSSKKETIRFLTNTTLGVAGLYDPAKTRFKLEPCKEDMGQALAHYKKIKKGPYLVLPIIPSGNVRDLVGQLLDCPLNPTSYVIGPVAMVAKSISLLNKTTYMQPLVKTINSTYADPYEITKKLCGIEKYIKNENLDRKEVLDAKIATQNVIKVGNVSDNVDAKADFKIDLRTDVKSDLKADIELNNYNPQNPLIDSMRTVFFEGVDLNDSRWSELSVWNKDFSKKIKTSSVNIDEKRPNYKYRYILQKDKTAPVAIIYPSIGEGIMSHHSTVLAKTFFDEGYSVIIQGSPFQWEFVKSMPESYKPGLPSQDAYYSRIVTSKILKNLQSTKISPIPYKFSKKILVGTSFGAFTTLFVASQEENNNTLNENALDISSYISINPPIEILFALKQVDKYSQEWKDDPSDIKMRVAITAEKVIQVAEKVADKKLKNKSETLPFPFTNDEAKLIIGFVMKQKLSDLVFTIENDSQKGSKKKLSTKKSDLYETINEMSYNDYAQKYLHTDKYESLEKLSYDTSLYSLTNFLQNSKKYKIYHTLDDYYVNHEQLTWLKKQCNDKVVLFNNGSHLGFLYRKEFMDEFKKDINLQKNTPKGELLTNKT